MNLSRLLKLPPNRQGIAIDALVILLNLFLFPFVSGRIGNLFERSFKDDQPAFRTLGVLMIFVLAGRLGGLYLKRFPLQARMRSSEASFSIYFLIFNAPIMILTAVFGVVLLQDLAAGLGLLERGYNGVPKESQAVSLAGVFSILALTAFEIYLLYRLGRPLQPAEEKKASEGNWRFGFIGEFIADFGLFAYMMIWQVFYYMTAALLLTPVEGASWGLDMQIFTVIFMLICFALFYISPRAVFLTEDRKYLSTWLFILVVFVSSLLPHWLQRITSEFF
jgi:hypothetical protein